MGLQIESGTGNAKQLHITDDNRADVSARSTPRIAYVSKDNGDSYTWSHAYNYAAGDTILLLSNSSTAKKLYIHSISVGSDTATRFTIHFPDYPTLAGTVVIGTNTNRLSGNIAEAEAYGNETGAAAQGVVLAEGMIGAGQTATKQPDGTIILGYHNCIAVDLVTIGAMGVVTISGYFE